MLAAAVAINLAFLVRCAFVFEDIPSTRVGQHIGAQELRGYRHRATCPPVARRPSSYGGSMASPMGTKSITCRDCYLKR